jgi:hypothetical protein
MTGTRSTRARSSRRLDADTAPWRRSAASTGTAGASGSLGGDSEQ